MICIFKYFGSETFHPVFHHLHIALALALQVCELSGQAKGKGPACVCTGHISLPRLGAEGLICAHLVGSETGNNGMVATSCIIQTETFLKGGGWEGNF